MGARTPETYRGVAEAAWRWVLDQVRDDDGPWIPESVPPESVPPEGGAEPSVPDLRDGMHSGIGGLAHVLAEIRLTRPWTDEEQHLADGIAARVRAATGTQTDSTYFDGLVSGIGVLTSLGLPGAERAVLRLAETATPDGWPQTIL